MLGTNAQPLTQPKDIVDIKASGNAVTVGRAAVVTPDIAASNGVIHVIDSVIMPPDGK